MNEPMLYVCVRHRTLGRVPILRRWFHYHYVKPMRTVNQSDFAFIADIQEKGWVVVAFRDRWPNES